MQITFPPMTLAPQKHSKTMIAISTPHISTFDHSPQSGNSTLGWKGLKWRWQYPLTNRHIMCSHSLGEYKSETINTYSGNLNITISEINNYLLMAPLTVKNNRLEQY